MTGKAGLVGNQHARAQPFSLGQVAELALLGEDRVHLRDHSRAVAVMRVQRSGPKHPHGGRHNRGDRQQEPPAAHPVRLLEVIHVHALR